MAPKREWFDCAQNSPEWEQLRCGLITASNFGALMAQGEGKMYDSLIHRVAGEIITGRPAENFTNGYMQRGKDQEAEARATYALRHACDPELVGFVRYNHEGPLRTGCSPDARIGKTRILQIKTQKADLLIKTILRDEFPPEHRAQVQGEIFITGAADADLLIFCPGMPPFEKRVKPDHRYIERLQARLGEANRDIDAIVKRIRARM